MSRPIGPTAAFTTQIVVYDAEGTPLFNRITPANMPIGLVALVEDARQCGINADELEAGLRNMLISAAKAERANPHDLRWMRDPDLGILARALLRTAERTHEEEAEG